MSRVSPLARRAVVDAIAIVARLCILAACLVLSVGRSNAQSTGDYAAQVEAGSRQLAMGNAQPALELGRVAVGIDSSRWEAYALTGNALLHLQRFEEAADALSLAIERAPAANQGELRESRRRTLLAESNTLSPAGAVAVGNEPVGAKPEAAAKDVNVEPRAGRAPDAPQFGFDDAAWVDSSAALIWARPWHYPSGARPAPVTHAEAQAFCSGLSVAHYSNWRLPTAPEVGRIYLPSTQGWRWSHPRFDENYGLSEAIRRGVWRPASFSVGGDTFPGNRLLIWTSTPGDGPGEHVAVYFGQPYSVADHASVGTSLKGATIRKPYQGYALCVRPMA